MILKKQSSRFSVLMESELKSNLGDILKEEDIVQTGPWPKEIKPLILSIKDLKNESVPKGSYAIVVESSGKREFYLTWLLEPVNLKWKAAYALYYTKQGPAFNVEDETLVQFKDVVGILSAIKSKPEEIITTIKLLDNVFEEMMQYVYWYKKWPMRIQKLPKVMEEEKKERKWEWKSAWKNDESSDEDIKSESSFNPVEEKVSSSSESLEPSDSEFGGKLKPKAKQFKQKKTKWDW